MAEDSYRTIKDTAEATFRELGSRFLAFAYPVGYVEEALEKVEILRKQYHDASHHCYAYRIGTETIEWRANDDGEPSGSAGLPIFNAIRSAELTNILIVVVRYFGGTKLGIPGLINAYRSSSIAVIEQCQIIEQTAVTEFSIEFGYEAMNDIMKLVKSNNIEVSEMTTDNICRMKLRVRRSLADQIAETLKSYATITPL